MIKIAPGKSSLRFAAVLLAGAASFASFSAHAASADGSASATVVSPISIKAGTGLDFGRFSSGSTEGTVVMGTNGARSATGGVKLASTNLGSAATFTVSGDVGATYQISLPSTAISMTGVTAGVTVGNFVSVTASGNSTLNGSGQDTITVGATLTVPAGAAQAVYSGTFPVSVEYN